MISAIIISFRDFSVTRTRKLEGGGVIEMSNSEVSNFSDNLEFSTSRNIMMPLLGQI